jgi:trans-2,3-dihydro-3-hydroxyanthranilate isomerase
MRQSDPVFGKTHDRAAVAKAIGLSVADLSEEYAPQTVSTGLPFCIVLLKSMKVAQRLQIAWRDAEAWLKTTDAKFFYCIAATGNEGEDAAAWHARMQFYTGEDPATGSAAGCCIAWLVRQGLAAADVPVVIEQGVEIRRPSRVRVKASVETGRICDVRVSGRTILVASGSFFLP